MAIFACPLIIFILSLIRHVKNKEGSENTITKAEQLYITYCWGLSQIYCRNKQFLKTAPNDNSIPYKVKPFTFCCNV